MKYGPWLGVACVALMAASCAPTVYNSGTPTSSRTYDVTSFNGEWRLMSGRSGTGSDWQSEQNSFNSEDWSATNGTPDRVRYGAWFLPDAFRINGDRRTLRVEDDGGGVIAELSMDGDYRYGSYGNRDYNTTGAVQGHWINDRRFEVNRTGRSGRSITQTFTLENRGRQLMVNTQVERDGSTRSYTRVYERV